MAIVAQGQHSPNLPDTSDLPTLWRRATCVTCHGSGEHPDHHQLESACAVCHAQWTPLQMDVWMEAHDRGRGRYWIPPLWLRWLAHLIPAWRNYYRWECELPCGHALKALRYVAAPCPACAGDGRYWQQMSRAEILAYLDTVVLPRQSLLDQW